MLGHILDSDRIVRGDYGMHPWVLTVAMGYSDRLGILWEAGAGGMQQAEVEQKGAGLHGGTRVFLRGALCLSAL